MDVLSCVFSGGSETPEPLDTASGDPLQTGFIDGGPVCGDSEPGRWDSSGGVDYGHGKRFASEETYFMTRVPNLRKP